MNYTEKIYKLDSLCGKLDEWRNLSKKIVYCHGNFNVVHPGHLRFLEFAGSWGDILIVSVSSSESLSSSVKEHFFDEMERSKGVSAVLFVDAVVIIDSAQLPSVIKKIKPDYYVKGIEHKNEDGLEEIAVKSVNGKIVYSSGGSQTSSLSKSLFHEPIDTIRKKEFFDLHHACKRHHITTERLLELTKTFSNKKLLVIGDTIVDQYVSCVPLGMSAESPVIVINEVDNVEFLGGAGVVARHIKAMNADCHYYSVIGNESAGDFVRNELEKSNIANTLLVDSSRPTTYKIRYMVKNQKLLRVSRLKDHEIDTELENQLVTTIEKDINTGCDGIVFCDYSYGLITQSLFERIQKITDKKNIPIYCDAQCSSQISDISRFKNVTLITPTEKEARIALGDKSSGLEYMGQELLIETGNDNVIITLGGDGLIAFRKRIIDGKYHTDSQHFPSLEANPVDVAGAGDSMLSAMALTISSGGNIMEASVLGTCVAALAINKLGNVPISYNELEEYIETAIRPILSND